MLLLMQSPSNAYFNKSFFHIWISVNMQLNKNQKQFLIPVPALQVKPLLHLPQDIYNIVIDLQHHLKIKETLT
jgi:hypothetical protein